MTRSGKKSYGVEVTKTKGPAKKFKQTKLDQFENNGPQPSKAPISNSKPKKKSNIVDTDVCEDEIELSFQQKRVIDIIMMRKSLFFTGAAGCGKSYVVRLLKLVMDKLKLNSKISFTASTGVAASNIGGMTIQAWSGIGKGMDPLDQILPKVLRSSAIKKRWIDTEILVIDEVSMMSAELFDKLSAIGSRVRNDSRPFGGIQVILCGDFFQLPPIGLGKSVRFCFEAHAWFQLFQSDDRADGMVVLDTVFRQKDDQDFLRILNEIRLGVVSPEASAILLAKSSLAEHSHSPSAECNGTVKSTAPGKGKKGFVPPVVRPTKLFSTNRDVDTFNLTELAKLRTESHSYTAVDEGEMQLLRECTKALQVLELKVGAQVMLLKNISTARGLVNGARGTVVSFEERRDVSSYFPRLPVVRFETHVGGSERAEETLLIAHESWDITQGDTVVASRIQLPLMLAYAISIHKSQGMTIPLLEVSFNNIFEYGQGYVALSRATCLRGLTLVNFATQSIKAHKLVADFYRHLETIQAVGKPSSSSSHAVTQLTSSSSSAATGTAGMDVGTAAAGLVRTSVLDIAADFVPLEHLGRECTRDDQCSVVDLTENLDEVGRTNSLKRSSAAPFVSPAGKKKPTQLFPYPTASPVSAALVEDDEVQEQQQSSGSFGECAGDCVRSSQSRPATVNLVEEEQEEQEGGASCSPDAQSYEKAGQVSFDLTVVPVVDTASTTTSYQHNTPIYSQPALCVAPAADLSPQRAVSTLHSGSTASQLPQSFRMAYVDAQSGRVEQRYQYEYATQAVQQIPLQLPQHSIQHMQHAQQDSGMSSSSASVGTISGGVGRSAGDVRLHELPDDVKRRVEANRLAALHKLKAKQQQQRGSTVQPPAQNVSLLSHPTPIRTNPAQPAQPAHLPTGGGSGGVSGDGEPWCSPLGGANSLSPGTAARRYVSPNRNISPLEKWSAVESPPSLARLNNGSSSSRSSNTVGSVVTPVAPLSIHALPVHVQREIERKRQAALEIRRQRLSGSSGGTTTPLF